jgi:hypothetical protein
MKNGKMCRAYAVQIQWQVNCVIFSTSPALVPVAVNRLESTLYTALNPSLWGSVLVSSESSAVHTGTTFKDCHTKSSMADAVSDALKGFTAISRKAIDVKQ